MHAYSLSEHVCEYYYDNNNNNNNNNSSIVNLQQIKNGMQKNNVN